MDQHDIMVHGIPNVSDAASILREELEQLTERFGPIQWVRMGPNRGFHRTNYAFVRYERPEIHQEAVEYLNRVGIRNTNIWFEINPLPTRERHLQTQQLRIQIEQLQQNQQQLQQQVHQQSQLIDEQQQQLVQQRQQLEQQLEQQRQQLQQQLQQQQELIDLNQNQLGELLPSWTRPPVRLVRNFGYGSPEEPRRSRLYSLIASNHPTTTSTSTLTSTPAATSSNAKPSRFEGGPCPICLEDFEKCETIVIMICGHKACENCMRQYIASGGRTCPNCTTRLKGNYYIRLP